ncbi:MAG: sugar kinase [bacterium]|nr:sugar kinase [bacterium]
MSKIVSLGIHIADILGRPVTHIPEGQNVAILDEVRITVAGTAAGTSVDLSKLGMKVYAMGALGTDELGNFVETTMQRYGIDTHNLVRKKNIQTSSTMLPIRENGERPALHVPGANTEFIYDDINFDCIANAEFLHVGGTPLMPKLDGEPMAEVFEFARKNKITTTYDLIGMDYKNLTEKVIDCLPYVDYFMPGLEEAAMMCGFNDRKDIIKYFLDLGAKYTVFKMAEKGSSIAWLENGQVKEIKIPAFRVPVIDSTGCGDAYCAGFITGLSMGWDLEKAGLLGTAAGGLVIQGLGSDAGIENLDKTIEFMDTAKRY